MSFLSNEDPSGVVEILMAELQTIDGAGLVIEPSALPPFFHIAFLSETNLTQATTNRNDDTSRRLANPSGVIRLVA